MTWTWFGVRSGKASTLIRERAQAPATTRRRVAPTTATRNFSASPMRRSIISTLRHLRAGELGLDREGAVGDDGFAGGQAVQDLGAASGARAHLHVAPLEAGTALPIRRGDEDDGPAVEELDGRVGHDDRRLALPRVDPDGGEHLGPEPAIGIGYGRVDGNGAGGRVEPAADP